MPTRIPWPDRSIGKLYGLPDRWLCDCGRNYIPSPDWRRCDQCDYEADRAEWYRTHDTPYPERPAYREYTQGMPYLFDPRRLTSPCVICGERGPWCEWCIADISSGRRVSGRVCFFCVRLQSRTLGGQDAGACVPSPRRGKRTRRRDDGPTLFD